MLGQSKVLGLNARNHLFQARYNRRRAKGVANSKLLTKSVLKKAKLPVPKLYRVFRNEEAVEKYDFTRLPESFVVKPNKGLGGEGILLIERGGVFAGEWVTVDGRSISVQDLKLHIHDILLGKYSLFDLPDFAFVEQRVRIHPVFEKISAYGTPDVGVLVFNRVPVMAFLRLPTAESGGRANMFQGAIACGVDIAAGVTVHAVKHTKDIVFYPGTRRRLVGVEIPQWERVLEVAVKTAETVGLGYSRVDLAIQPKLEGLKRFGPMVLEINAQPGLKIQLANKAGLLRRLERVEGLKVDSAEKGIKLGQVLFGDPKVVSKTGLPTRTVRVFEEVEVVDLHTGDKEKIKAKLDTGAYRTSIDRDLAERLGLLAPDNVLLEREYRSSLGREMRPLVEVTFYLAGRKIKTVANVAGRKGLRREMIIGRRDLQGFVIAPKQ